METWSCVPSPISSLSHSLATRTPAGLLAEQASALAFQGSGDDSSGPALGLPLNAHYLLIPASVMRRACLSLVHRGLHAQAYVDSREATGPEQGGAWACQPGRGPVLARPFLGGPESGKATHPPGAGSQCLA